LWIQGLSIAALVSQGGPLNDVGNISIIFENPASDSVNIGFQTTRTGATTEENFINTEVFGDIGGDNLFQSYTNVTVTQVSAVPEPSTLASSLLGIVAIVGSRRLRRRRKGGRD
jgi:hypothetical protein